ncbi:MAG: cupin domain-containing protein [Gammaproteobacteria bacterium]|jgi:hypothetical protein
MSSVFPEPITNLPEADIPLEGVKGYLSQSDTHQIVFMEFSKDVDLPEHSHAAQVGIVLEGTIDLTIDGKQSTYIKGDRYYIPAGVPHSAKIYAGYADITSFDEADRFARKKPLFHKYLPIDNEEYKNHHVFSVLDKMADFYRSLGDLIFCRVTVGLNAKASINIDSYFYPSVKGTIESIKSTLKNGRINDAYALLRKFHDSSIINIYSNVYLEDNCSLENFIVEKIQSWICGKDQLPEYRIMSQYIRDSKKLTALTNLLYKDDTYKKIRDRCQDHLHYNYFHCAVLNDNERPCERRISALNMFLYDIRQLFILHISYLFYLKPIYMMSSDYEDHMDMGHTPPENCQYWVARFVQEIFDEIIKKDRPDIAKLIKEDTCMYLE